MKLRELLKMLEKQSNVPNGVDPLDVEVSFDSYHHSYTKVHKIGYFKVDKTIVVWLGD